MWKMFKNFADNTIPWVDNVRKLVSIMLGCLLAGFSAGMTWQKYILNPSVQQSTTMPASAIAGNLQTCDALSEVRRVQATYDARVEPIQERWLQLTAKLERDDLLPSERVEVVETAALVQKEMERTQAEHQKVVESITQSCKKIH